jgi:MFS family permease
MFARAYRWFDRVILELGRELRLSYLPPLMVYFAYGVAGLTSIVGTFFVKDYLGLSAAFLAALAFWVNVPWALKMPIGHLVDLIWRFKSALVFFGAGLTASSLAIMLGLLAHTEAMREVMPLGAWYVLSTLLAPVGYVIQDVVADAMTVEAVPRVNSEGVAFPPEQIRLMHTTMQTLGRVAIVGGGIFVALLNVFMFEGVETLAEQDKVDIYINIYQIALLIPVISVLGVTLGGWLKIRDTRRLMRKGFQWDKAWEMVRGQIERPAPNWWILGGSLLFVVFTITMGLSDVPYNQEIIFLGSLAIVLFLMFRLVRVLEPEARRVLVGTAIIIFVYRAMPGPGPGSTWWMIDELDFDQHFLSVLSLISSSLALLGMFIFRRFMAEKSIAYIMVFLTIISTVLTLPVVGMYYGLHEWSSAVTGGIVDARFIALVDTALESPLGQVAMIPMLAWIANSAPANLKATFFAVMASFTNLALSLAQLGTKYLNEFFTVSREVKDTASGVVTVPADYSELGLLLVSATVITFVLPIAAVALVLGTRLKTA